MSQHFPQSVPVRRALVVLGVSVGLSIPPMRSLIEQGMVWHMAVQMPLLVLGGWLSMRAMAATRIPGVFAQWNQFGLTGFIAAQAIIAYWMLPLAIDRAVVLPSSDVVKLIALTGCGAMLEHSMKRAPVVLQLFFVGYLVSMMTWLGFYFATTDLRLCNAYSLESQAHAGAAIVGLGIALGFAWLAFTIFQVQRLRHPRGSTA